MTSFSVESLNMTLSDKNSRPDSDQLSLSKTLKEYPGRDLYDHAAMVLFVVIVTIFIFIFRDYGYSWDEVTQNRWYGQAVLRFIQSLGEDKSALYTNNFYFYGGP